jgi:hypothetical protein
MDPEPIIKAAKSLALFGMGSSSGLQLLTKGVESAGGKAAGVASSTAQDGKTKLQNLHEKYQTEYEQDAASAIQDLKKDLDTEGVSRKIQVTWEGNPSIKPNVTQLKTLLAEARKGLDEALTLLKSDSESTKQERPSLILSSLRAVHRFHKELRNGITALHLPAKAAAAVVAAETESSIAEAALVEARKNGQDDSTLKERLNQASSTVSARRKDLELAKSMESSALQAVANVCNESLTRWMKQRQEANRIYETSILLLGEVTSQKGQ